MQLNIIQRNITKKKDFLNNVRETQNTHLQQKNSVDKYLAHYFLMFSYCSSFLSLLPLFLELHSSVCFVNGSYTEIDTSLPQSLCFSLYLYIPNSFLYHHPIFSPFFELPIHCLSLLRCYSPRPHLHYHLIYHVIIQRLEISHNQQASTQLFLFPFPLFN